MGQVATYGEIAQQLKLKSEKSKVDSRVVGWVLHANRDPNVPCHRVVDCNGRLAPNFAFDGSEEQRRRLQQEGITFVDENHVDMIKCRWQME